jgi:predicted DNA-binding WGR domain protein
MRRFEFHDDRSHKFWEIERDGAVVTTRWGRIGAAGQT